MAAPAHQDRGLAEQQDDSLIEAALADGYITRAAGIIIAAVVREVRTAAGHRARDIVEIGGNAGDLFNYLEPWAVSYVNVEPGQVPPMVVDPRYRTLRESAAQMSLADASADLVISIASFDHIPEPSRALTEIARVLRPGGLFVITLNNEDRGGNGCSGAPPTGDAVKP